jgi:hypothetical protein
MRMKNSSLSEAERVARTRDLGRKRKSGERERHRDAGRPIAATVDRAVVDAVRDFLAADPTGSRPIPPDALMRTIALHLLRRSHRAYETGTDGGTFSREGVEAALRDRLLTPVSRAA